MSKTVVTGSDRNKAIFTMLRWLVLCVAVLCLPASAQPVYCKEDAQCSGGNYCETDANICRNCLSCEDLKREPPPAINTCIKSVAECGACINGLVADRRGNVNAECVPPVPSQLEPTSSYMWILISFGVLLFLALVVGIIAYLLRYPEIFKPAGSNQSSTVTARITATAPEAPPPYNPLPQSPYHAPLYSDVEPSVYNEDEQFIKRPSPRPQDARESAGNQAARVFNKPSYLRDPPTPSAESPEPEYTESMTLPIPDEDTMPSPWIPGTTSNGDVNANVAPDNKANEPSGAGAALAAQLSAARDTTLVEHSAAKRLCVRQDTLPSSGGDSPASSCPRASSPGAGGPPYFITQITNVVQINTTK